MLQPEQIIPIVDSVLSIAKKAKDWSIEDLYNTEKKKPDFYPGYVANIEAMQEIRVHAVRGVYPERIITSRAPNMTEAEQKYIRANYKQITMPLYVDYINTIGRAFSDNNWSIDYGQDDAKEGSFRDYVERGIAKTPVKMSLESYIKHVVPGIKTVDAMGCIAMKPYRVAKEEVNGQVVISSDLFEPIPVYYPCDRIHAFDDESYYLFLTYENSVVRKGNKDEKTGFIYELYDKGAIWRIIQVGEKIDNQYIIEEYYRHDENDLPVKRLSGFPVSVSGHIEWISPFSYAVPLLDDAVIDANMLRGVKATCMFPYRVMTGNICEHKMSLDGEIKCCDGRGWFDDYEHNRVVTCTGCGGSGLRDRISPYGVMLMKPDSVDGVGEMKASQPAMSYVAPGVEVPKFTRDEIELHIRKARQILHLRDSSTKVQSNEDTTATGMVIDEKAKYAFIKPISDQIFDIYAFCLDWIGIIRYGSKQEYVLTSPITFDFKTEYDYLIEISEAIKNGLPPFVVHTIVFKYLKTMFYNQLETAAAFDLIVKADRLLVMDDEELNMKLSKGIVAPWEVILHDSAVSFVIELQAANPSFFNQDTNTQLAQLIDKAKQKAGEVKTLAPGSPQDLVRGIMNRTAPIPIE